LLQESIGHELAFGGLKSEHMCECYVLQSNKKQSDLGQIIDLVLGGKDTIGRKQVQVGSHLPTWSVFVTI